MPTKKSSAPPKKTQKKPKVVTGSGAKKKQPSFWANTPRTILLAIFALSFGAVGFYLLKSSLADTGTTITVASWNSKIDNKKNIAGQTKTLLKTADVVGLQEVHTAAQRNNIRNLIESDKYAVSPKAHTNNDSGSGVESYPIVWREKEFVRTAEGTTGQVSPSLDGLRPRYITWVKLKQRATGKQFYVVNTHMVRDVDSNGSLSSKKANVKAYTGHMEKLVNLVKKLQKDNVPIFVTGDFAMDYRKDTGKVGVFPKAALGAIGVKSSWQLTNLEGISSKAKTYGSGSRLIDYVFAWNVVPKSTSIGKSRLGSDHNPVFFTADLTVASTIDTR